MTKADLIVNKYLLGELKKISDLPIISEEEFFETNSEFSSYWLIDPIDGTKSFIDKSDEYSIMISLVENGEPVLGVVFAPSLNKLYYGIKNGGSYVKSCGDVTRLNCVNDKQISDSNVVISRHNTSLKDSELFEKLNINSLIPMGSIGIKLGEISLGNGDLYINLDGLNQWDLGPAHIILTEAGGEIFDKFGDKIVYNSNVKRFENGVIAVSNKNNSGELIKFINAEK